MCNFVKKKKPCKVGAKESGVDEEMSPSTLLQDNRKDANWESQNWLDSVILGTRL